MSRNSGMMGGRSDSAAACERTGLARSVPARVAGGVVVIGAADAGRVLLASAGLAERTDRRATGAAVRGLIERLGYVQVDSISVVERAHHHILWARMHGYTPAVLTRLHERERAVFEGWTHDASLIPSAYFRHWKVRYARRPGLAAGWWGGRLGADGERVVAWVLGRIEREGPLGSADFEHDRAGGDAGAGQGWWNWSPQKAALEWLWRGGRLMVVRRRGFNKVYDLTERVLPAGVCGGEAPTDEEHAEWMCRGAMERLGIATAAEIAGFWGAVTLAEARAWCAASGLERVVVERADGGKPVAAFACEDWGGRAGRGAGAPKGMRLLSPFDPAVRDRKRLARLFGFDYTFEAFTPAAKRKHGYYVLPVLEGDRFVARVDPRLDRARGVLEIRGVWWEEGVKVTRARRRELDGAVGRYAGLCGVGRWEMPGRG